METQIESQASLGQRDPGSIAKQPNEEKLLALCERLFEPLGLRTVDVDVREGHRSLVRVFIEKRADRTSPTLDDCASASRLLGTELDAQDFIPGAYDLEVSSPGLDCRLRLKEDFDRVIGDEIKLKLTSSLEGLGANARGKLLAVDLTGIRVLVSGQEHLVAFEKIKQANRVWHFS